MKESVVIFKKELLELFRDKLTFMVLIVPIIVFPLFNVAMNSLSGDTNETIKIAIISTDESGEAIFDSFVESSNLNIDRIAIENSVNLKQRLNNGDIDCYLCIDKQKYRLIYNSSSYHSLSMATKVGEGFSMFYSSMYSSLNNDFYTMNICDENGNILNSTSSLSNLFIPVMVILFITQGVTNFANDMFAGERERKTLELLILSGTKKSSLYFGKSLALFVLSIINFILCIASFFISFDMSNGGIEQFKFIQNGFVGLNIVAMIISLLLLASITVFVTLTISLISNNIRNAQMLNELIISLPVLFILLLSLGVIKSNTIFNYIPILNLIVCFGDGFSGKALLSTILLAVVVNLILIVLLICFSLRYLKEEKLIR